MTRKFKPSLHARSARCGLILLSFALLAGCSLFNRQAPDFLLLNSYFPSWLVGAIVATPITVALRYGLIRAGIDDHLPLRLFVYLGLWLILALSFAYVFSPR